MLLVSNHSQPFGRTVQFEWVIPFYGNRDTSVSSQMCLLPSHINTLSSLGWPLFSTIILLTRRIIAIELAS